MPSEWPNAKFEIHQRVVGVGRQRARHREDLARGHDDREGDGAESLDRVKDEELAGGGGDGDGDVVHKGGRVELQKGDRGPQLAWSFIH